MIKVSSTYLFFSKINLSSDFNSDILVVLSNVSNFTTWLDDESGLIHEFVSVSDITTMYVFDSFISTSIDNESIIAPLLSLVSTL